jgi:hypothetical protein
MDGYARIEQAMLELEALGVPAHIIARVEEAAVNACAKTEKARRAQMLLPLGAAVAAERLGVCRRTVYNLAARARESASSGVDACTSS